MRLYDPSRHRIGALPTLLSQPDWVVPQLTIWPEPEGTACLSACLVRISAMIPATAEESFVARQVSATTTAESLPDIIAEYSADPEQFLSTFFHITLEAKHRAAKPKPNQTTPSHDDIGV